MNQEMWSKSLLASYRILPKIVKSIDSYTMTMALGSFSYAGNTLDLMQKIIDNNKRKEALINAKVIVDTTLADLKPKYRQVLEMKYIDKKSFEDIADILGICLRTVFRRYAFAIKSFSAILRAKGYDEAWLEKRYARDSLFIRLNEVNIAQLQKNSLVKANTCDNKTKQFVCAMANVAMASGAKAESSAMI